MILSHQKPRILLVTPEITSLPSGMGNYANYLTAKAGGLADVSASLVTALFDLHADIHVALPDYRALFNLPDHGFLRKEIHSIRSKMPEDRIHLAEDRAFFYRDTVYSGYASDNSKSALAFQREVINNIIPRIQPDIIHCNDWMTGLIPAASRALGIPCLFTVHNIHTIAAPLWEIEDRGIDAAMFWQHLYYRQRPFSYEETRDMNPVDFLTSGIFAAHFVNTVSRTFLQEIISGRHDVIPDPIRMELCRKWHAGCAAGILNAPDPSFSPAEDPALATPYTARTHPEGKQENKRALQHRTGLRPDPDAPLFFWPSRLDTLQKGCQLLADILYALLHQYREENLSIVFVANGEFKRHFHDIRRMHGLDDRLAICDFDEELARLAYGGSDFLLMPSRFEPCGLPQMIGPLYGTLPVAHDTGGIHDTVEHLTPDLTKGNGFLFETWDTGGLFWAIEQAMAFHRLPESQKAHTRQRIMEESQATFTHARNAASYIHLYERMLERPLVR